MRRTHFCAWALALSLLIGAPPVEARGLDVHALTDVRIVTGPGRVIENGTVVIRDGVIEAAGAGITPPADARIWERTDLTVYPGLIDPYVVRSWPVKEDEESADGSHENKLVRPERSMTLHGVDEAAAKKLRGAGFTTAAVAPQEGIFRGRSAVVNLGDGTVNANLLKAQHAHNLTFATSGAFGGDYPGSLMGSIALVRQTFLDARWHEKAWAAYKAQPAQKRPEMSSALASLADAANGKELVVIESDDPLQTLRAAKVVSEFGLNAHLVGSGLEYQWLDEISELGRPLIVPLSFPDVPEVPDEDDLTLSLEDLRKWDLAPGNAKALIDAGNTVAFTSHGNDDAKKVLTNAHIAIDRGGLSADEALAALTTTPARLLGISSQAGTIEVGKMANLVLTEGDLFAEKPAIREVWIDGKQFEIKESKPPAVEPAGTWNLTVMTGDGQEIPAVMTLEGDATALSGTISNPQGDAIPLSSAEVSGSRLEVTFDGTAYGMPGTIEFSLDIEGDSGSGSGMSPAGDFTIKGSRTAPEVVR